MIHDTAGQIRVDCLMAQDPQRIDMSRDFLIRFFTELEKRLNNDIIANLLRVSYNLKERFFYIAQIRISV